MPKLTREFAKEVLDRLDKLPMDREPAWGTLRAEELIPHLIGVMKTSTGELPEQGFYGNWFTSKILPPIIYATGMLPPHNLKTLNGAGEQVEAVLVDGTVSDLAKEIEAFIAGLEAGTINATVHPLFGDIGPEGWSNIHHVHFKHHLKQFQL